MMGRKLLLVEGNDDFHVVCALFKYHDVPNSFKVEDKKGVENLLKTFPVVAKGSEVDAVAVLVDADVDILSRWASLRNMFINLGYSTCPDSPPLEGLVIDEVDLPRLGAWIMPNNSLAGMLEDFIAYLVPANDELWAYAYKTIEDMPEGLAEFKSGHTSKALLHTWLAWKDDPGTPMGLAITKRWLDPEAATVEPFLNWIQRMFNE